ncbi:MAG: glycosyltransferase, partial [Longimicrobiales bacterium]
MRIYCFAHHYPVPYKPYYDTQFADLVEAGHEVTIFAGGRYESTNEKVVRYGLDEKTQYFPTTLRTLAPLLPSLVRGAARDTARSLRIIRSVNTAGGGAKERVVNTARAFSVDNGPPDLCFVHGLGTAVLVSWLRRLFPGVPVAMYYHGGEVPSVRELASEDVRRTFEAMDVVFTNTTFSR